MNTWRNALIIALACLGTAAHAADEVLQKALADEMARTLADLRLEDSEPPYFVSYKVHDDDSINVEGSFGGLISETKKRNRTLSTQIRIGGYDLDNTNFFSRGTFRTNTTRVLPLASDYHEIRRVTWRLTDAAYRNAVDLLAGKRAAMRNYTVVDQLPDFNREEPVNYHEDPTLALPDIDAVTTLVRELSAISNNQDHISNSFVQAFVTNHHDFYLNSENTSFTRVDDYAKIVAVSKAKAKDGQNIADFVAYQARTWDELPSLEIIAADIESINSNLKTQQSTSTITSFNGPVLFRGQAAAELWVQILGRYLTARRAPITDTAQTNRGFSGSSLNPFEDKIGARVLPRDISIHSDPTLAEYDGNPMFGRLSIDDEGVKPMRVELIRRGILKTLLSSRVPTKTTQKSTGSRRNFGALGNLIVESRGGLLEAELMEEFNLLVEEREAEFGMVITRLMSPVNSNELVGNAVRSGTSIPVIAARKVYPNGDEEPVRNLSVTRFQVGMLKDIVATSETSGVYLVSTTRKSQNGDFGSDFAGSVSTPDLLIEDVTLRPSTEVIPSLPIISHPVAKQ